ncbi:MAG TPA: YcjX family protein [Pseudomonas xinjiangensis]|uniref:YcjX family protein n=2 Tax=root TaxID=1 RepID=A0A7V1BPS4_9GAMM|nr:YcjX family protein [Halopseudomonas xinjiangensis]HEC49368.1 YcjX family protein [Halopseudomonas xinjiangensis]
MGVLKKAGWIEQARQQADRLTAQRIRIGVTGLSAAGKTTFITSLINQLENHQRGLLARRSPFERLESVRWQKENLDRPFPYLDALQSLSGEPAQWPQSTQDLSRVLIDLRFRPQGLLRKLQGTQTLKLEILDYPGEWLLDLPLLRMNYGQWCEQMRGWLAVDPRRALSGAMRDRLLALEPSAGLDAEELKALTEQWTDFLKRCRSDAGLARNQPGRFLLPGSGVAADMLSFVPLLAANQHSMGGPGSWWAECEARFNYYRDYIVKGFYDEHFSRLDRQVLLVDMLAPMDAGQPALEDLKGALEAVLESFRYGRNSLFEKLFKPRINGLAVCATKVDQVIPGQQRAVQQCLEDLITDSLSEVRHGGVDVKGFPLSAIRAARQEGEALVAGLVGQAGWVRYQPGSIPEHLPLDLQVNGPELLRLRPPPGLHRNEPFPHYRMDDLLSWILDGSQL